MSRTAPVWPTGSYPETGLEEVWWQVAAHRWRSTFTVIAQEHVLVGSDIPEIRAYRICLTLEAKNPSVGAIFPGYRPRSSRVVMRGGHVALYKIPKAPAKSLLLSSSECRRKERSVAGPGRRRKVHIPSV